MIYRNGFDHRLSSQAVIGRQGGTVATGTVATVVVPAGALGSPSAVQVVASSSNETNTDFQFSAHFYRISARQPQEIRILTAGAPLRNISLLANIPQDFLAQVPAGGGVGALAQVYEIGADDEVLDEFRPLASHLTSDRSGLDITVPPWVFTNRREASHLYEALIVVAAFRGRGSAAISAAPTSASNVANEPDVPTPADAVGEIMRQPSASLLAECPSGGLRSPFVDGHPPDVNPGGNFDPTPTPTRPNGHWGEDLHAGSGDPVVAVTTGTITEIGYEYVAPTIPLARGSGWGWYVILSADDGRSQYRYAHLSQQSLDRLRPGNPVIFVPQGGTFRYQEFPGLAVPAGAVIGAVGTSGGVSGPHLHLEVTTYPNYVELPDYVSFTDLLAQCRPEPPSPSPSGLSTGPSAAPGPNASSSPTPTVSSSPTPTGSAFPTPTPLPSVTATPSPSPTPAPSPSPTPGMNPLAVKFTSGQCTASPFGYYICSISGTATGPEASEFILGPWDNTSPLSCGAWYHLVDRYHLVCRHDSGNPTTTAWSAQGITCTGSGPADFFLWLGTYTVRPGDNGPYYALRYRLTCVGGTFAAQLYYQYP